MPHFYGHNRKYIIREFYFSVNSRIEDIERNDIIMRKSFYQLFYCNPLQSKRIRFRSRFFTLSDCCIFWSLLSRFICFYSHKILVAVGRFCHFIQVFIMILGPVQP